MRGMGVERGGDGGFVEVSWAGGVKYSGKIWGEKRGERRGERGVIFI